MHSETWRLSAIQKAAEVREDRAMASRDWALFFERYSMPQGRLAHGR